MLKPDFQFLNNYQKILKNDFLRKRYLLVILNYVEYDTHIEYNF